MGRSFETGWAGIADHIWAEMKSRYPQLWVLAGYPLKSAGKEPNYWSKTKAIWTIHAPEPLTDDDRLRRSSIPGVAVQTRWYYCLASSDGNRWAEILPYESVEETVASNERQIPILSLEWLICIRITNVMERIPTIEVWQCRVQPDQLQRWRTNARQEASGLFDPDPPELAQG